MNSGYVPSIFLFFALIFSSFPCPAEEKFLLQQSNLVNVKYEESLGRVAQTVTTIYPEIKNELETRFKSDINFIPTITLIRNRGSFQQMITSGPVVAVAISNSNLIVIDNSRMKTYPFSLRTTLKHEMCHLFLHQYVAKGQLPRWLNEGICQNISDGIAEVMVGENKNLLKQAVLTGKLLPMKSLEKTFPSEERQLLLAYEQSKSFVEYIEKEHGSDKAIALLDQLKAGNDMSSSLRLTLSTSYYELEKNWQEHLRARITWFTYFSSHIYQILFLFTALSMVYGFVRFWIRKRNYIDEDDDEIISE